MKSKYNLHPVHFIGTTRGGKRGGRGRDDQGDANEYSQTKPSAGVSLFDFLEEKIPGGGECWIHENMSFDFTKFYNL